MPYVIIIAATFLLCWGADKLFTKLFRSKPQHASGQSVRLNKYYAIAGIVLVILGVAAQFAGGGMLLVVGGVIVALLGVFLIVYYLTFGIFYDDDSFVVATFGKKSATYAYRDIQGQLLYNTGGKILIELHMRDGRTVQLQSNMIGTYVFLDKAFAAWLRQTGRRKEDCPFHDPDNSCWFPTMEG